MLSSVLMTLLLITGVFLILLVLVQRGKGGGLAGAFGGMGGQSAFGTKAGDLFTRVTIGVATFWILLCLFSVWSLTGAPGRIETGQPGGAPEAPVQGDGGLPSEGVLPGGATGDEAPAPEQSSPAPDGGATGDEAPAPEQSSPAPDGGATGGE